MSYFHLSVFALLFYFYLCYKSRGLGYCFCFRQLSRNVLKRGAVFKMYLHVYHFWCSEVLPVDISSVYYHFFSDEKFPLPFFLAAVQLDMDSQSFCLCEKVFKSPFFLKYSSLDKEIEVDGFFLPAL